MPFSTPLLINRDVINCGQIAQSQEFSVFALIGSHLDAKGNSGVVEGEYNPSVGVRRTPKKEDLVRFQDRLTGQSKDNYHGMSLHVTSVLSTDFEQCISNLTKTCNLDSLH